MMPDQALRLMANCDLCVLATTGENGPHCSLMSYMADADGSQIFLVTQKHTRKYLNILQNPSVGLLFDDREEKGAAKRGEICALTLWGEALPCSDPEQKFQVLARMKTRHPHLAPIIQDPEVEVVIVRLTSWQFLDGVAKARSSKMA